jgi:hypothetical protein
MLLLGLLSASILCQDPVEIIRKSTVRDSANYERVKNYTYQERTETREYDRDGKINTSHSKTSEIVILSGQTHKRLIARDDKTLSTSEARREQEKLEKELVKSRDMPAVERARLDKQRAQQRKFLQELPDAFTFKLAGQENVSGRPAWVIEAEPKAGFHAKDSRANLLTNVRGKVWVDQAEYQWVKAEAEVIDTFYLGLMLLRVAPGGHLSYEQTRVNDEVWLPARLSVRVDARVALLKNIRAGIDITYRDYKKFQADSRIITAENPAAKNPAAENQTVGNKP